MFLSFFGFIPEKVSQIPIFVVETGADTHGDAENARVSCVELPPLPPPQLL